MIQVCISIPFSHFIFALSISSDYPRQPTAMIASGLLFFNIALPQIECHPHQLDLFERKFYKFFRIVSIVSPSLTMCVPAETVRETGGSPFEISDFSIRIR